MKNLKLKNIILVIIGILTQLIIYNYNISSNILLWEISLDLILIAMGFVLLKFIYKNYNILNIKFNFYDFKTFFYSFMISNIFLAIVLIIGFLTSNIITQEVKNYETILIGIIFDIPAFVFFSIFTILIEEIFFKIFLFNDLKINNHFRIIISTLLYSFYKLSNELFSFDDGNNFQETLFYILNLIIYYFSIGITSYAIFYKTKNILNSFVFRIGFLIFIPFLLNQFTEEKPTLFKSESIIFSVNGILISFLLLIFAIFTIVNQKRKNNEI